MPQYTIGTQPQKIQQPPGSGWTLQNAGPGTLYLDNDPSVSKATSYGIPVGVAVPIASGATLWGVSETVSAVSLVEGVASNAVTNLAITGPVTVGGNVNATITNASVPISGTVNANITNASIPVSGSVSISSGTVNASISGPVAISSGTVSVSSGQVSLAAGYSLVYDNTFIGSVVTNSTPNLSMGNAQSVYIVMGAIVPLSATYDGSRDIVTTVTWYDPASGFNFTEQFLFAASGTMQLPVKAPQLSVSVSVKDGTTAFTSVRVTIFSSQASQPLQVVSAVSAFMYPVPFTSTSKTASSARNLAYEFSIPANTNGYFPIDCVSGPMTLGYLDLNATGGTAYFMVGVSRFNQTAGGYGEYLYRVSATSQDLVQTNIPLVGPGEQLYIQATTGVGVTAHVVATFIRPAI